MSNFLDNLIARNTGGADVLQPRLTGLFEPVPSDADLLAARSADTDSRPEGRPEELRVESPSEEQRLTSPALSQTAELGLPSKIPPAASPARPAQSNKQATATIDPAEPSLVHPASAPPAQGAVQTRIISPVTTPNRPHDHETHSNVGAAERAPLEPRVYRSARAETIAVQSDNHTITGARTTERSDKVKITATPPANPSGPFVEQPLDTTRTITLPAAGTIRATSPGSDVTPSVAARQQSAPSQVARDSVERSEPTIKVTIGRIDVRAIMPAPPARRPAPKQTARSLEDYLKQRSGGRR